MAKLLSVQEVATLLGLHKVTIYDWVSQRRVPFVKVGRRTMFDPREIERWLEGSTVREQELSGAPARTLVAASRARRGRFKNLR